MHKVQRSVLVPYSAAQMFDLVADVEKYPEFMPWCGGAEVQFADVDPDTGLLTDVTLAAALGLWVLLATCVALFCGWAYSSPPFRFKRSGPSVAAGSRPTTTHTITSRMEGSFMPSGGSCGCGFSTSPMGPLKKVSCTKRTE